MNQGPSIFIDKIIPLSPTQPTAESALPIFIYRLNWRHANITPVIGFSIIHLYAWDDRNFQLDCLKLPVFLKLTKGNFSIKHVDR